MARRFVLVVCNSCNVPQRTVEKQNGREVLRDSSKKTQPGSAGVQMTPRIMKSDLTKPPRWYVVTRYTEKEGINSDGEKVRYLSAQRKYDVTEQMEAILKAEANK